MSEAEKTQKTEKLPKPIEKFIWLVISCAIAAVGYLLKTGNFKMPVWLGVIVSVALLVSIVIAAQKASSERAALANNPEKKLGYALRSIVYYLFVIIAVVFIFMSLWFTGILSI